MISSIVLVYISSRVNQKILVLIACLATIYLFYYLRSHCAGSVASCCERVHLYIFSPSPVEFKTHPLYGNCQSLRDHCRGRNNRGGRTASPHGIIYSVCEFEIIFILNEFVKMESVHHISRSLDVCGMHRYMFFTR